MTVMVAGAFTSFSSVLEAVTTTVSSYFCGSSGFCSGVCEGAGVPLVCPAGGVDCCARAGALASTTAANAM